jgi:hypothetical protein
MARLEILSADRKRVFELLDDRLTIGGGAQHSLRLVGGAEFALTRGARGFRLESTGARAITVNGQECRQRELRDGDRIELGSITIVYRDENAPPEPSLPALLEQAAQQLAPAAARTATAGRRARNAARPRRGGLPGWLWASTLLCVAASILFVIVQALDQVSPVPAPADLLALAENQLTRGEPQRALATIDQALASPRIDSRTRQGATQLRARVTTALERQADSAWLAGADRARDLLRQFQQREEPRAPARPFARELIRRADAWLETYGARTKRYPESAAWAAEVEQLRARYAAAAELGAADRAADVLYRADLRSRQTDRPYRLLLEDLDRFAAAATDPADRSAVEQARARYADQARSYVARRLREIEALAARGERDAARRDLDELETTSALPEHASRIATARAALGG